MRRRLAGRLLVAAPELADPNFARSVLLLLDHGSDGAIGVVLDRPSQTPVGAVLPGWDGLASAPGLVHVGGPVQRSSAICIGRLRDPRSGPVSGLAPVSATHGLATVDLDADPDQLGPALQAVRVFAGYAGWSAGQLEQELDTGGWYVVDSLPGDAFADHPGRLWRDVLRRQGPPLALVSTFPADPACN